jgi:hypothetical protein
MKIEIFFRNLDKPKQDELLQAAGVSSPEEMNWDAFPVADMEIEPEIIEGEKPDETS